MMKQVIDIIKWVPLLYLKFFAKLQLNKIRPLVIGVTGSAGKTSTVHALEAVIKKKSSYKVTHHANSETGIPLHILDLQLKDYSFLQWLRVMALAPLQVLTNWKKYSTYIIEMGIDSPDSPKNMSYLLSIVQPSVGIFLNAGAVHAANFDHLIENSESNRLEKVKSLVAAEKGKLIEGLPESGFAILNLDDPNVAALIGKTKASVITYGVSEHAAVSIKSVTPSLQGTWISLKYNDQNIDFIMPKVALPQSYAHSFAAAIAAGVALGIPASQCVENIKAYFELPPSRMSLLAGLNNSLIIDSSYNASPQTVIDALSVLKTVAPGRKLALLGDMRELGQESQIAHEAIAKEAQQVCDRVYLVGPLMYKYALPVLGEKAVWLENAARAVEVLKNELQSNDTLLVKGSQNTIFLEHAVVALLKNQQDKQRVCRQDEYWRLERIKNGLVEV